ncbi:MAG: hypothetical protein M3Y48_21695 [Actinomycetota bacterium]|nr:hypothetical protein [Actinomycetota bacterium]
MLLHPEVVPGQDWLSAHGWLLRHVQNRIEIADLDPPGPGVHRDRMNRAFTVGVRAGESD